MTDLLDARTTGTPMTRRQALTLLSLGAVGLAAAACGPSASAPAAPAAQPTAGQGASTKPAATSAPAAAAPAQQAPAARSGPTTISFWGHNDARSVDMYKQVIADFEKANPNIKVDYQQKAGNEYAQLVLTALASGSAPDVFRAGDWQIGEYIRDGAVQPIPTGPWQVGSARELAEKFVPGVQKKFFVDGGFYATPESDSQLLNIVNLDYLKEAGFSALPKTVDEWIQAYQKMTVVKDGKWIRSGFEGYYQHELWQTEEWTHLIRTHGGTIYSPEGKLVMDQGDAALKAGEYLWNTVQEWKFSNPAFALTFGQPTPTHFETGNSAANPAGSWKVPSIEKAGVVKSWQATRWITGPKDHVLAWAWSLAINKNAKDPEAASTFLAYLHAPDVMEKRMDLAGMVPALKGMENTAWAKSHPEAKPWFDAQADAQYQDPYPSYPKVSRIISKMYEDIAIVGTKPQQAIETALADLKQVG